MSKELTALKEKLAKYEQKMATMGKEWAAGRGGSRYSDEYQENQIKVYQVMIDELKLLIHKAEKKLKTYK